MRETDGGQRDRIDKSVCFIRACVGVFIYVFLKCLSVCVCVCLFQHHSQSGQLLPFDWL